MEGDDDDDDVDEDDDRTIVDWSAWKTQERWWWAEKARWRTMDKHRKCRFTGLQWRGVRSIVDQNANIHKVSHCHSEKGKGKQIQAKEQIHQTQEWPGVFSKERAEEEIHQTQLWCKTPASQPDTMGEGHWPASSRVWVQTSTIACKDTRAIAYDLCKHPLHCIGGL